MTLLTSTVNKLSKFRFHVMLALFLLTTLSSFFFLIYLKWQWPLSDLFTSTDNLTPKAMIAQLFLLSNLGMAFICGGLLAIVSVLLQQIVKNNLASDSTLAVGSGALFTMVLGLLFFPNLAIYGSFWVAFLGALISLGLVIAISLPSKLDPLVMVISGFVVSIFFNAIINLLMLFDTKYYSVLTIWSSGLIYQINWQPLLTLTAVTAITLPLLMTLHKPLTLISLDDTQARRLGLSVTWVRLFVFVLCAILTALVVSEVGLISFVGLGAATIVNAMQIRHIRIRLFVSFLVGGLLLGFTNNILSIVTHFVTLPIALPAGSFTGLLGAPLMIWLIYRQRKQKSTAEAYNINIERQEIDWFLYLIPLFALFILALVFVKSSVGWHFSFDVSSIYHYRLGRSLGAISTGILLALSGVVLQQMTRNPMASPEVLGISSAASISMVLSYLFLPMLTTIHIIGFGILGSLCVLIIILWLMRQVNNSYLLLIGFAIASLSTAFSVIIGFSKDPRLQTILNWLSGTTYHIHPKNAYILLILALGSLVISRITIQPIKLLSLSETVARGRGLSIKANQIMLLVFVATLSTIATISVGPLSFVGLVIPQIARSLGAIQIEKQLPLSAILGGLVMLIADWTGRYVIFPYEIPAGILASVFGGGYFLFMLRRFK